MENKKLTIKELEEKYAACMKQGESLLKQIEEKKKEEEKQLAEVKDARKKEIGEAFDRLLDLMSDYTKDYGSYEYEDEDDDDSFPYLYHWFF